jgi:cell division protein FtsB
MAFEVAFILVIAIVLIVTIAAMGRPLAEAYAEKLKTKYREIGSQEAHNLKENMLVLQGEVLDLKAQVKVLQENSEYVSKLLESPEKTTKKIQDKG